MFLFYCLLVLIYFVLQFFNNIIAFYIETETPSQVLKA